MFKINKFIKGARVFPSRISNIRCYSQDERCIKYECKRPKVNDDLQLEELREMHMPNVFAPCHPTKVNLYKNLFLFLCVPAIICAMVNALTAEEPKRPKFVEYSYMRIRNKGYPWDPVRTLFHNPRYNALPTGYEEEVPEEMEYDPMADYCDCKKQ